MIALDTNILVYAHRADSPLFGLVRAAVGKLLARQGLCGVPVACLHEFLAVVTNPKIFMAPTPIDLAFQQMEVLLAEPNVQLLGPTNRHLAQLRLVCLDADRPIFGGRIHDARIAALCLENGVTELWSADRDFSAFPALKVRSPQDLLI